MDTKTQQHINKDLILRERLAIERTSMANDRTLLSFVRTSLYFIIAGITLNNLLNISYGFWLEISCWAVAILLLVIGFINFYKQKKKLKISMMHVGNYQLDWDED